MRAAAKKVSDLTIDEFKTIIHEVVAEDLDAWRETFEMVSDKALMKQIKRADDDWLAGKKGAYNSWNEVKGA
jgi:hypothetical protein